MRALSPKGTCALSEAAAPLAAPPPGVFPLELCAARGEVGKGIWGAWGGRFAPCPGLEKPLLPHRHVPWSSYPAPCTERGRPRGRREAPGDRVSVLNCPPPASPAAPAALPGAAAAPGPRPPRGYWPPAPGPPPPPRPRKRRAGALPPPPPPPPPGAFSTAGCGQRPAAAAAGHGGRAGLAAPGAAARGHPPRPRHRLAQVRERVPARRCGGTGRRDRWRGRGGFPPLADGAAGGAGLCPVRRGRAGSPAGGRYHPAAPPAVRVSRWPVPPGCPRSWAQPPGPTEVRPILPPGEQAKPLAACRAAHPSVWGWEVGAAQPLPLLFWAHHAEPTVLGETAWLGLPGRFLPCNMVTSPFCSKGCAIVGEAQHVSGNRPHCARLGASTGFTPKISSIKPCSPHLLPAAPYAPLPGVLNQAGSHKHCHFLETSTSP